MSAPYILRRDGHDYQAPDLDTLRAWAQAGRVLPGDMVYSPVYQSWYRASDLRGLRDVLPSPDAGAPPVVAQAVAQCFWLRKGDQNYSAESLEVILQWASDGIIDPDDYIFHPSYGKWFQAGDSPQLVSRFPPHIKHSPPFLPASADPMASAEVRTQLDPMAGHGLTSGTAQRPAAPIESVRPAAPVEPVRPAGPVESADSMAKTVMDMQAIRVDMLRPAAARPAAPAAGSTTPAAAPNGGGIASLDAGATGDLGGVTAELPGASSGTGPAPVAAPAATHGGWQHPAGGLFGGHREAVPGARVDDADASQGGRGNPAPGAAILRKSGAHAVVDAAALREAERIRAERLEAERASRAEAERASQAEAERLEAELASRAEAERASRAEAERASRAEAERASRAEAERASRAEAERASRAEAERASRAEAERTSRAEAERASRAEAERLEAERARRAEVERVEAERARRIEAEREARPSAPLPVSRVAQPIEADQSGERVGAPVADPEPEQAASVSTGPRPASPFSTSPTPVGMARPPSAASLRPTTPPAPDAPTAGARPNEPRAAEAGGTQSQPPAQRSVTEPLVPGERPMSPFGQTPSTSPGGVPRGPTSSEPGHLGQAPTPVARPTAITASRPGSSTAGMPVVRPVSPDASAERQSPLESAPIGPTPETPSAIKPVVTEPAPQRPAGAKPPPLPAAALGGTRPTPPPLPAALREAPETTGASAAPRPLPPEEAAPALPTSTPVIAATVAAPAPAPLPELPADQEVKFADRLGLMKLFYDVAKVFVYTRDLRPGELLESSCTLGQNGEDFLGTAKRGIYHRLAGALERHIEGPVRAARAEMSGDELAGYELMLSRAHQLLEVMRRAEPVVGQKPPERFIVGNTGRPKMSPEEESLIVEIDTVLKRLISTRAKAAAGRAA
jgi:hypothetical protein